MLKVADLAGRADFDAGPLHISPARRLVEGPAGSAHVEPIVMKVFLLLLDAAGGVVTRNELFDQAWGGVFVGDDSLNRAIARIRKIASEMAPGLFEIETIPRTGYRLTGAILDDLAATVTATPSISPLSFSRRGIVAASAAALALTAGAGGWAFYHNRRQHFWDLLKQAQEGLEYNDGSKKPATLLQQAVQIDPEDAAAQGLLAYAFVANTDDVNRNGRRSELEEAEAAAAASLRLDPGNANAQLARILLERSTLDLAASEDRLRAALRLAPNNIFIMRQLWNMLQSVGRSRDAMAFVQRAIAVRPLAASNNFPLAQLLWITGRTAEADRVIDRALQTWPDHPFVRFARFTILAFTGRPAAARAMLESGQGPQYFSQRSVQLWRTSLLALEDRSAANVAQARDANIVAVKENPGLARQALLVLPALGQVDAAFDIANQLFVYRTAADRNKTAGSTAWRFTPFLFVPPTAPLRADPRFGALADGIGLTAYWAKRGVRPDYQLAAS